MLPSKIGRSRLGPARTHRLYAPAIERSQMIAMVIAGVPAGLVTYLFVSLLGRKRQIIAYVLGLLIGLAVSVAGMKLIFGRYDIVSLGALAGAVLGPVAALKLSKPYGFDY